MRMKFLIAITVGLVSMRAIAQGPPPATVLVDPVRVETLEQRRPVTGEIRALRISLLAAEEEGLVEEFNVREGDVVKAGDVIAKLSDVRARLAVEIAEATVQAAQARLEAREAERERELRDFRRMLDLAAKASASESEVDEAETSHTAAAAIAREAAAELVNQKAALDLAKRRLEDMTIRAPFDGRITSRQTEVGEWIGVGAPIAELLQIDRVEAWIDVPARYLAHVRRPGVSVEVQVTSQGVTRQAPVTQIIPRVDELSGLFPVRIELNNDDAALAPGMDVIAQVPTGTSAPSTTISKDAVLRDDVGQFIYYAGGSPDAPQAMVARIRTLYAVGNRLVVDAPMLRPGMLIVTEGTDRLFPTQPLMISNPEVATQGAPAPDASSASNGGPPADAPQPTGS